MKSKKVISIIMAMILLVSSFALDSGYSVKGSGDGGNSDSGPSEIVIDGEFEEPILTPGQTIHVKVPVKAIDDDMRNARVSSGDYDESAFTIKNMIITNGSNGGRESNILRSGNRYIEFDVVVKENATIKTYKTTINIKYKYDEFDQPQQQQGNSSFNFNMRVIEEKSPAQLTITTAGKANASIGKETSHAVIVKNEGELVAKNVYVSLDFSSQVISENVKYSNKKIKVGDILPGKETTINFPISILPTATSGLKAFKIKIDYKDMDGESISKEGDIYIDIRGNTKAPRLEIASINYSDKINVGDEIVLAVTLDNQGDSQANKIKVSVGGESIGSTGFIKNYFTETIDVDIIKSNSKRTVKIPLIVSKEAISGLKQLEINASYKDAEGVERTVSTTIYPEVAKKKSNKESFLHIRNVSQSPMVPNAGGQVNISFVIENKGRQNLRDIKLLTELSEDTFSPLNSNPYVLIEKLAAGKSKRITMPFTVSDDIKEGLNQIILKTSYYDDSGKISSPDSIIIPVLNVANEGNLSKPKLIISKFEIDKDDLKAGDTVNFTFQLKNTNPTVRANNITVTLSQKDNIFAISQGSNSFFIDKIGPGEVADNTVEMKVKSDASTNTYPLTVELDYEYEGAEINPVTGEIGESKTEEINLLVVENSRPVIDYVNIYSMTGMPTVNESATLNFEFYNMGKSTLNNVIATIEGDFAKVDGDMFFIGNVEAGASEYVEFDVMPMVEGMASGVLKITYEDSNGDEVEFTKEFEATVEGAIDWNEFEEPGPEIPPMDEGKKPILKVWQLVLLLILIISIVPFVTKSIIIGIYKKKMLKEEEEEI